MEKAVDAVEGLEDISDKLGAIPEKVTDVIKNIGSELGELDMMAKAKAINDARKKGNEVKDRCEKIKDSMNVLKKDVTDLKSQAEQLQDFNKLLELGKTCQTKNKTTIKDCYELIYEPIKAPAPEKKGANGCCVTF